MNNVPKNSYSNMDSNIGGQMNSNIGFTNERKYVNSKPTYGSYCFSYNKSSVSNRNNVAQIKYTNPLTY